MLGITQQPGKTVSESVAAALEGRSGYWCSTMRARRSTAAADLIEAILAHSATVRILATSREGIGVADEQLRPVPSLAADGIDSAAVQLFVERAQSMDAGVAIGRRRLSRRGRTMCRRLDGIPLAIELAASRMASMTASRGA